MESKPEIFLSYAHKNKEDVDELYDILTSKYKLNIWKDTKSIRLGYDFREEIYHGIEDAKLVISCMSKDYLDSKTCLKELKLANKLEKPCLFVLLEDIPIDTIPSVSMLVIGEQRSHIFRNRKTAQSKLWVGELFNKFITDLGLMLNKDLKKYDDEPLITIKRSKDVYHAFLSFNVEIQPTIQVLSQHFQDNDLIVHYLTKDNITDSWKYFMKIKNAIDASTIFICCVTKNYLTNQNCLNEFDYAVNLKKPQMVLLFDELNADELKKLASYTDGKVEPMNIYLDTEKSYMIGAGTHFKEVLVKLQEQVDENKPKPSAVDAVVDKMQFLYDLFVTCDDEQIEHVAGFLSKLQPMKNLKIFHEVKKTDQSSKRRPNYDAINNSETVLAIVSKNFQQSDACVAELSYAHRNYKPTNILMEDLGSVQADSELNEIINDVDVTNIQTDFSVLDKSVEENPLASKIAETFKKLHDKDEVKVMITREKTQESIKRGASARIKSAKSVVAEPVTVHIELHDAAEQGNVDELKHWVSQARNLNERNSRGMTPIHLAAKEGHLSAVKFLLQQESLDKQEKDSDGRTALHLAASDGKYEVVQYLCKEGKFDINAKDWRGLTPLHLAAQWGFADCVSFLCDNDAKINEKSKDGWTALQLASENRREVIAKLLRLKGAR